MKKAGHFTVPTNGNKTTLKIGFVPKVVLIEYVAKDHPEVGDVILRIFIDATGPTVYWYPQLKSNSETKDFVRFPINQSGNWPYGKIALFGEDIEFETTNPNDFIGKTFNYYATNEAAGTFTTCSYQHGVVNVPKSAKDVNIFVSLPFAQNNLTTAYYVDCVEEMPSPTFDAQVRLSRWSIPSEHMIYYIDPNGVPGDTGETGIINSYDNYFVFRSNAPNTRGVSCTYYLMPRISDFIDLEDAKDYFIYNIISNSPNMTGANKKMFYKYKSAGKLALYKVSNEKGFDLVLKGTDNIKQIFLATSAEGDYSEVSTTETRFLRKTQVWSGGEKYYQLTFRTNIPIFAGDDTLTAEEQADEYLDGNIDETEADNYDQIAQEENLKIDGNIGDNVNETATGVSHLSFTTGVQVYALSSLQKGAFFHKLFDENTTPIASLLGGLQLFGSNEIGCIQGLHYIPFNASEVCTMGSQNYIMLGSYKMEFGESLATCLKNNKYISCGSAYFKRTYNDYRDFEPYCQLYVSLPYAGTHKLQLSKYIGKSISVHYCVDITTGALMVRILADNVLMDTFDGNCATHIPITAVDHAQQTNAVITGLLNTSGSTIDSIGSFASVAVGAAGAAGAAGGGMGGAIAAGGNIAAGGGNLLSGITSPIASGYHTLQASMNAPVTTRGSYAGNLGNFGIMHVTFIFAWLNTVVPANEIELVGKPSNKGGSVGSFAGFLQCSAFNLANDFAGTDNEANEIYSIMSNGVYVS